MEVMEDGNLMDKVHILIQRDMEYYEDKQSILQQSICPGIVGGRLDFPLYASFAAVKLVLWWEDEFLAGFRKDSGLLTKNTQTVSGENKSMDEGNAPMVKSSDPQKFSALIAKSSEQILDHLHVLTQEALDHADLSVLTGTIGATALLKNSLWFYIRLCNESDSSKPKDDCLQNNFKKFQEMSEALAERLLDLHCRLLSLYVLQDAESLDWDSVKPFFESERGSYTIQMWWIYMKGTRDDLWNTVPPEMARRVFSGMLSETLTILTVRYTQAVPSECRTKLMVNDLANLLFCIAQLLPAICNTSEELLGLSLRSQNKIIRDVHTKCKELLVCFLTRGAPLELLYKVFRKGADRTEVLKPIDGIIPWIPVGLPHVFSEYPTNIKRFSDLPDNIAIYLEITVLLSQPQPKWSLLLKVLCMRGAKVLDIILKLAVEKSKNRKHSKLVPEAAKACQGFLCQEDGACANDAQTASYAYTEENFSDLTASLTYILLMVGNTQDYTQILVSTVEKTEGWSQYFDKRQVWSQSRPAWLEAILELVNPILQPIVNTVVSAVQTGATMYQAMSIVLGCFIQMWICIDITVPKVASLLQDALTPNVIPLGNSVLVQILIASLYTRLLRMSEESKKRVSFADDYTKVAAATTDSKTLKKQLTRQLTFKHTNSFCSFDGTTSSEEAILLAVAEGVCSIDEDDKHTEEIGELLKQAELSIENERENEKYSTHSTGGCRRVEQGSQMTEILASDLLMTSYGKRSLKTAFAFIRSNYDWIFEQLNCFETEDAADIANNRARPLPDALLYSMFHVGEKPFDQILTGEWSPDWQKLFKVPIGLTAERLWTQISKRWEFQDKNASKLSRNSLKIVTTLTDTFKSAYN